MYIYINVYEYTKEKLATIMESNPEEPLLQHGEEESATPFLWLHHSTLDSYLIVLSVKQR